MTIEDIFKALMIAGLIGLVALYLDCARAVRNQRKERATREKQLIPNLEKTIAYFKEHDIDSSEEEDLLRIYKEQQSHIAKK